MNRLFAVAGLLALTCGAFAQDIQLPSPQSKIGVDLLDSIRMRAAARNFVKADVPVADLSTMLWAGNGVKGTDAVSGASKAGRTIPYSGDNAYGNLYVLDAKGVFRYDPQNNLLKRVSTGDLRASITPENIPSAAFTILFTADTTQAPPFMKTNMALFHDVANASAAYSAENIALAAAVYKLSSIVMYNIKPEAVAAAAKLAKEEVPLFILQVGYVK